MNKILKKIRSPFSALPSTKKGFTFFELLVVIAILVVIVAASFSTHGYIVIDTTLDSKTHELVENLKLAEARASARYQNSSWGMYFDQTANHNQFILFKGSSYASRDSSYDLTSQLPSTLSFSSVSLSGGGSEIVFDKVGKTSQDGTITISASDSKVKSITVNTLGAVFISTLEPMKIATGSYTGNNSSNRAITGVGFTPDIVIIKDNSYDSAVIRTSTMGGDATKKMTGGGSLMSGVIKSLDGDGFTVGSDSQVNSSSNTYYWIAFKQANGNLKVGSYVGNGTSQSINGLGFSPEYAMVLPANSYYPINRSIDMASKSYLFEGDTGDTSRITSFNTDGFSVGNGSSVNASGITYYYAAWNVSAKHMQTGSYTGDGTDNRNITGVGFQPHYVIIVPDAYGGSVQKTTAISGDNTLYFSPYPNFANALQSLQSDGFQVGSDSHVNTNGTKFYWIAF